MSNIATYQIHDYLKSEDQRWVAPAGLVDLQTMETITLLRSAFDLVTAFPNGFIPSGIVLGRVTASGLYRPYVAGNTDGSQTPVGFLGVTVPADKLAPSTANIVAALYWRGVVNESFLPTGHGLDANARTSLTKFRFITQP